MSLIKELTVEAAGLLAAHRARPGTGTGPEHAFDDWAPKISPISRYGKAHFAIARAVHPDWLGRYMERVVEQVLSPMMGRLAAKIPPKAILGEEHLELPKELDCNAFGEHCVGDPAFSYRIGRPSGASFAIRGILTVVLIKDRVCEVPWQQTRRQYDIMTDEIVLGPCALLLRFDVYEQARAPQAYSAPDWRGAALQRALRHD